MKTEQPQDWFLGDCFSTVCTGVIEMTFELNGLSANSNGVISDEAKGADDQEGAKVKENSGKKEKTEKAKKKPLFGNDGEDVSFITPIASRKFAFETGRTHFREPMEGVLRKPGVPILNDDGTLNAAGCLQASDFVQDLANCYFISTLHAIAESHPGWLESMVQDHGDGTYTVDFSVRVPLLSRFFGGVNHSETVNASFPGSTVKSKIDSHLLAQIIEKAYARWMGSYDELEWGIPYFSMTHITGARSTFIFVHKKREEALYRQIQHGIERGFPMVAGTLDILDYPGIVDLIEKRAIKINARRTEDGDEEIPTDCRHDKDFDPKGLVANFLHSIASDANRITDQHCFSVVAVNEIEEDGQLKRTITLRNPRFPSDSDLVTLTFADFQKQFFHLTINHAKDNLRREAVRTLRRTEREQDKQNSKDLNVASPRTFSTETKQAHEEPKRKSIKRVQMTHAELEKTAT